MKAVEGCRDSPLQRSNTFLPTRLYLFLLDSSHLIQRMGSTRIDIGGISPTPDAMVGDFLPTVRAGRVYRSKNSCLAGD